MSLEQLDCFENVEDCYIWRWELSSIDLLPQKEAAKVKKARTARKKLQGHHKAIVNLIAAIDKVAAWIQSGASKPASAASGDKLVSNMEEKVLKFEREEEQARMLREAKLQKEIRARPAERSRRRPRRSERRR